METMLNVKEVAKATRLAPSSVYALVTQKSIPHYRIGSRVVFSQQEVESWLKSQHEPVQSR